MNRTMFLYVTIGVLISSFCVANTDSVITNQHDEQDNQAELMEAFIKNIREQFTPFFNTLSDATLSDHDLELFARATFDKASGAQDTITHESVVETARQLHTLIHILGYSEHASVIVANLKRIASISSNNHVRALVAYLEKNTIDLSDVKATID